MVTDRCSRELSVENNKSRAGDLRGFYSQGEEVSVLGRPGSDLLFQALRLSTIGAGEFNGRVRDGIGYGLPANTTRPAKDGNQGSVIRHQLRSLSSISKQAGH